MSASLLWGPGWTAGPMIVLPLVAVAWVYLRGFRQLRHQSPHHFPAWRRGVFLAGLALLFVALASPLDGAADMLLLAHMVQHWLLIMVVPPLIWLGAPIVPLLRGLPGDLLRRGVGPLLSSPALRRFLAWLGHPAAALGLFTGVTWGWHWPAAYQWALVSRTAHDFEHLSFLAASLLLWHCILEPWPIRHPKPFARRLLLVAAVGLINSLFSAGFAFSAAPFYPLYAELPNPWSISALEDQNSAGAFMWIGGSLAMIAAAVGLTVSGLSPARPGFRQRGGPLAAATGPGVSARLARALASRRWRRGLQWTLFGLALVVVLDGFLGSPVPSSLNLAGVLPWTYGRVAALVFLVAWGNFFCGVCPLTLSRGLAGRALGRPFRWPTRLKNKWLSVGLFVFYLWSYEILDLWNRPAGTALWIAGLFGLCFLVEGLFPRGSFCRYVCPVGQFQFVHAGLSPGEVRPLSDAVCAECTSRDCLLGNSAQPGCPTELYLPSKAGNLDCTFCMDCVRACPEGNAAVIPVRPGASLGRGRVKGRGWGLDLTVLGGLFVWGAFVNAMAMSAPFVDAQSALATRLGFGESAAFASVSLVGWLVVPPVLVVWPLARLGGGLSGVRLSLKDSLRSFVPGLVPLGLAMWLAHFSYHLLTGLFSGLPALERALHELAPGVFAAPNSAAPYLPTWTVDAQLLVLGLGFVVSVGVLWRLGREIRPAPGRALALILPWSLLALALWGLGVFVYLSPMAMRGMMG